MGVKKVLVLGGNFGGLTAALTVQYELRGEVNVTVLSANDQFLFNPSLISLPFGKRVTSTTGQHDFDYLVIATGHRGDFAAVPGLGPGGNAHSISSLDDAVHAGEG